MHGLFAPVGSRGRRASVCLAACAATSDNPTRGEDTELAARPRMARRNGPIGARGVDARHSTYHRNRCRRRSRCIVNPRARMKKPHTPHAPASRETPREGEPRPRWSMRAAGPARVGASAGRPRAPDCPCARGVGSRFEFINSIYFFTWYRDITSYLHTTVNMYSCS